MVVYYQGENTANVKIYHITSGILLECSAHVFTIMKQLKQPQHYFVSKLHYSIALLFFIGNAYKKNYSFKILSKRCLSFKTQFKIEFLLPSTGRRNVLGIIPDLG